MTKRTYLVPDMSCDHCVGAITDAVGAVAGVTSLEVDLAKKTVAVDGGEDALIRTAIDDAGYDIASS